MTTITLNLPNTTFYSARQAADTLKRPIEEVLTAFLGAMLPSVENVPPAMRDEVIRMTWLDTPTLWQITQEMMPASHQKRMSQIVKTEAIRTLTPDEERELDRLRQEYGRITLRKARAYALLSLRSGQPLLN